MTTAQTTAALVADPLSCYRLPTPLLERTLALLRTSYGGCKDAPQYHAAMRRAEDSIAATLRARRAVDAAQAPEPVSEPEPAPSNDGGSRVLAPVGPTVPTAPAGAVRPDVGADF